MNKNTCTECGGPCAKYAFTCQDCYRKLQRDAGAPVNTAAYAEQMADVRDKRVLLDKWDRLARRRSRHARRAS